MLCMFLSQTFRILFLLNTFCFLTMNLCEKEKIPNSLKTRQRRSSTSGQTPSRRACTTTSATSISQILVSLEACFLENMVISWEKRLFTENKIYNLGNNNGGGMSTSSALAIAVSALAASSGGHQPETNNNSILSAVHQPMQVGFTIPLAQSINFVIPNYKSNPPSTDS